jgi:hypothetical protein
MSKLIIYHQHLTNSNGIVNPNVSTSPLASYLEADVVYIENTWELMELWLIFARVENVESRHVSTTLPIPMVEIIQTYLLDW